MALQVTISPCDISHPPTFPVFTSCFIVLPLYFKFLPRTFCCSWGFRYTFQIDCTVCNTSLCVPQSLPAALPLPWFSQPTCYLLAIHNVLLCIFISFGENREDRFEEATVQSFSPDVSSPRYKCVRWHHFLPLKSANPSVRLRSRRPGPSSRR